MKRGIARCAENKKMAAELMLFNAADDISSLSAGVTDGFMSSVAMGR